jgi:hypothetical protein
VDAGAVGFLPVLYLLWQHVVQPAVVAAVTSALALSLVGRGLLKVWLHHQRRHGRAMSTILAVGTHEGVARLVRRAHGAPLLGWRVSGTCTSTGVGPGGAPCVAGVPVLGDLDAVAKSALGGHFDAVAVCPTPGWTPARLQQLACDLDGGRTQLLVDPVLVGHVDTGVRVAGVSGLPLLRLTRHTLCGPRGVMKEATDRIGAVLLLLLVAPVLVSCAVAVRRDGGPMLVRQARVGRHGRTFAMLSFRTTAVGSQRMTPVGRVLRARGLDELPLLFNVLGGSMALIGPRPAAPGEDTDGPGVPRHLLVKPGITVPPPRGSRAAPGRAASEH